jgi:peptide subunit release factor 1 (eRF1)
VEKEVHDHLVHTAEVAFDLYKRRGADRVLVGAPEELIGEFKGKLHPYLRERIAGKIQVDVENASLEEVRAAAGEAIEAHVTRGEREALDRLTAAVGRGGRGAAGIAEVLDALNQARVETLLIAENFRAAGRVDFEAGLLLPEDADQGEPVEDIVEPAIEKAIEQSAHALVIRHHDDLVPLGGIGAVLRF